MRRGIFPQFLFHLLAFSLAFPLWGGHRAYAIGESIGNTDGDGTQTSDANGSADTTSKSVQTELFTGSAAFQISIVVAPGKDGMQPSLGLSYSSDGSIKSPFGMRWTLEGLADISRRGAQGGVAEFSTNDRFYINDAGIASDLIVKPGLGDPNEFTTTEEHFFKITKNETTNRWIVKHPDGTQAEFSQPILRINPATGVADFAPTDFPNTRKWVLTKLTNPNGYSMTVTYIFDSNGGDYYPDKIYYTRHETDGSVDLDVGRVIEFAWESRGAQATTPDYSGGSMVVMDQRLVEIRAWADPAKAHLFTKYRLFYDTSNVLSAGAATWPSSESQLTRVEQYGTGASIWNRWIFDYTSRTAGWAPDNGQVFPYKFAISDPGPGTDTQFLDKGVRLGDVDGDADLDLVKGETPTSGPPVRIVLQNTLSQGFIGTSLVPPNDFVNFWDQGLQMIDINGDGRVDMVQLVLVDARAATCNVGLPQTKKIVWLNNGHGWSVPNSAAPIGSWEYLSWQWTQNLPDAYFLHVSVRSGTSECQHNNYYAQFANLNNDRCPDLMVSYDGPAAINNCDSTWTIVQGTGTIGELPPPLGHTSGRWQPYARFFDANGDGLTDKVIAYYENSGFPNFRDYDYTDVFLNEGGKRWRRDTVLSDLWKASGVRFVTTDFATNGSGWPRSYPANPIDLVDVNGDGYLDVVTSCELFINQQNLGFINVCPAGDPSITGGRECKKLADLVPGVTACTPIDLGYYWYYQLTDGHTLFDWGTRLVDLDGDGLVDFVNSNDLPWYPENPQYGSPDGDKVYRALGSFPGLLSRATLPTGGTVDFEYKPSTAPEFATIDGPGNPDLPFVKQLLWKMTVRDGRSSAYVTTYQYEGGAYDFVANEFRGFWKATATTWKDFGANLADEITQTYFHQIPQLKGKIDSVREYVPGNAYPMKVQQNFYTTDSALPNCALANLDCSQPYFNPLRRQEMYDCDGDATCRLSVTLKDYRTDANGLLTLQIDQNLGEPGVTPSDKRTTLVTRTVSDPSAWLVNVPIRKRSYQGLVPNDDSTANLLRESVLFYDSGSGRYDNRPFDLTEIPASPRLIRTETHGWLNGYSDTTSSETQYDTTFRHPTATIDARAFATRFQYDADPEGDHPASVYVTKVVNPLGDSTTTNYDLYGRAASVQDDRNGVSQISQFDLFHRPMRTTEGPRNTVVPGTRSPWREEAGDGSLQRETRMQYFGFCDQACTASDVRSVPDPNHQYTRIETKQDETTNKWTWSERYQDGLGRNYVTKSMATDARGDILTQAVHDDRAKIRKVSIPYFSTSADPPANLWTLTEFDPVGRVRAIQAPSDVDNPIRSTMVHNDWTQTSIDPKDHRKDFRYNGFHQLEQVTEYVTVDGVQQPHSLDLVYDVLGNLTAVTNHAATPFVTTTFYDGLGRKRETRDPDSGIWTYSYDAAGNILSQRDARGNESVYAYDAINRIQQVEHCTGLCTPSAQKIIDQFRYDTDENGNARGASYGRITQAKRGSDFIEDSSYDPAGRLARKVTTIQGVTVAFTYSYFNDGAMRTTVYDSDGPSPETVTYEYNSQGAPKRMAGSSALIDDAQYSASGKILSLRFGNRVETQYVYNNSGDQRISQIWTHHLDGGQTWLDLAYLYDGNSNVSDVLDSANSVHSIFGYDDVDRLTQATLVNRESRIYQYDILGNLKSLEGPYSPFMQPYAPPAATSIASSRTPLHETKVTANAAPKSTQRAPARFAPNSTANTIIFSYQSGRPHALSSDSANYRYDYDSNGNLTTRTRPDNSRIVYDYDAANKLSRLTDGSAVTQYLYSPTGDRIAKISGGLTERYFGPIEIRGNGSRVKYYHFKGERIARRDEGGALYFFHPDYLHSTSVMTNVSGTPVFQQTYYEFGAIRSTLGPLSEDYGYTGHLLDRESQMTHTPAREYASAFFHFTQPDTIVPALTDPQSHNRYAYVRNNPMKYIDPSGHLVKLPFPEVSYVLDGMEVDPSFISSIPSSAISSITEGVLDIQGKVSNQTDTASSSTPPGTDPGPSSVKISGLTPPHITKIDAANGVTVDMYVLDKGTAVVVDALDAHRPGESAHNFWKAATIAAYIKGYDVTWLMGENATRENVGNALQSSDVKGLFLTAHGLPGGRSVYLYSARFHGGRATPAGWFANQLGGRKLDFLVSVSCGIGAVRNGFPSLASQFYGYKTDTYVPSAAVTNLSMLTYDEGMALRGFLNGKPFNVPGTASHRGYEWPY